VNVPSSVEVPARFINRELSWLAFNERVLEEAADPHTPLLERLRFAAIVASNLDEFFMVRVAGLQDAVAEDDATPDLAGMTPRQQLAAVHERTHRMVARLYALTLGELLPGLAPQGIEFHRAGTLPEGPKAALMAHFMDGVLPVLTPVALDPAQAFPVVSGLSLNLAVTLRSRTDEHEPPLAIVQVPAGLTRLVAIAQADGSLFVLLEDLLREHVGQLFPGREVVETAVFRVTRDAEVELDAEGGRTRLERVEREVKRRRRGDVVRLEIESSASAGLTAGLARRLEVGPEDVYAIPGPIDLRVLNGLADLDFEHLRYPPVQPANGLAGEPHQDLFALLDERDVLLHHPYESYDPVVALTAAAADDPDVLAIKLTLYRASPASQIIRNLQRAADRQKQVTVVLELTARFDEERNIGWARALEESGAHVIYGIRGYKVHAKALLVVRRGPYGLHRYVHLGTGNYNERTARLYTDFSLMTASRAFAEDVTALFTALTGYSDPPRLRKLVMAPTGLRARLLQLISRERRRAESGQAARILAKMNSLIDEEIIEALYAASAAGVRIRLNVRGICALRPGVTGLSENIEVISVVDRFLEHSRIYCFSGDEDERVYLASADWMTRNLDRRVELMFPVESPDARSRVLSAMRAMFRDTVKARTLGADGVYVRKTPAGGEPPFRAQQYLLEEARRRSTQPGDAGIRFRPEQTDTHPTR
jgi:polyphosphate kinase